MSIAVYRAAVLALSLLLAQSIALPADHFKPFNLKTIDGSPRSLRDYLNKITLVTFFFPSCGYCNAAFPHLQKVYDKYKDRGLSMVTINIVPEQVSQIPDWQSTHQYTFPVLVGASIESAQADYGLKMTPTHFLLDSQGKVILRQTGYKPGDEKILEDQIKRLLSPSS